MIDDSISLGKRVSIHPGTAILEKHGPGEKEEEIENREKEKNLRPDYQGSIRHGTTSGPTGTWA